MSITLSKEGCLKNNITLSEAIQLLIIYNKIDMNNALDALIEKGLITKNLDINVEGAWRLTNKGKDLIDTVILDSSSNSDSDERYIPLATELKNIFPKGKKDGTHYYWSEGIALIIRRLKLFYKKYGKNYTDEQIISAARRYVNSFNGDYAYMRLLKYFILKEKVGAAGDIEGDSELISWIENEGQEDLSDNWTSTLK